MFDVGWSEMALILLVALVVIGPKDLPRVARTLGKWTAKARGMAREFQRSLDDMAREAELQDLKAEMDKLTRTDMRHRLEETIDPDGALRRSLAAPTGLGDVTAAPPPAGPPAALEPAPPPAGLPSPAEPPMATELPLPMPTEPADPAVTPATAGLVPPPAEQR
ncbi:MAG: Sec-independent protein translocase protein TatB [Geminicoccaceae bacterium]